MLRDTDQRPKLILPRTWVSMDHTPNLFWPKQPPPPKHLRRSAHAAPSMRKPQLEPTEPTSDTVPAPSSTAAAMPSMEPELRSAAVEPAAQGIALPVTPEEPTPPEPPEPIAEPVVQPIEPDAAEIERVIPELVAREPAAEVADSSQQASEAIVANPSADVVALPVRRQPPKPDSVPLDRIDEPPAKPRKAAARVTRTKKQPEQPATDRDAIIQDIAKVCYPRIKRVCVIGSANSLKINGHNDRKVLFIGGEWPAHGEFPKEFLVEMLGRHDGRFVTREHTEYQHDKFNIAPVEWTITVGPEAKLQFVEACLAAKADRQQHVILDLIAGQPPLSVVREDFEWVLRRPFSSISLRTGALMRVIVTGVWGDYFIILRGFSP